MGKSVAILGAEKNISSLTADSKNPFDTKNQKIISMILNSKGNMQRSRSAKSPQRQRTELKISKNNISPIHKSRKHLKSSRSIDDLYIDCTNTKNIRPITASPKIKISSQNFMTNLLKPVEAQKFTVRILTFSAQNILNTPDSIKKNKRKKSVEKEQNVRNIKMVMLKGKELRVDGKNCESSKDFARKTKNEKIVVTSKNEYKMSEDLLDYYKKSILNPSIDPKQILYGGKIISPVKLKRPIYNVVGEANNSGKVIVKLPIAKIDL